MTTLTTKKLGTGFYQVLGVTGTILIVKDSQAKKQWGGGATWDVMTPRSEDDANQPLEGRDMTFLIECDSKQGCLARLEILKGLL